MGNRLARAALVALVLTTILGWVFLKGWGPIKAALLAALFFVCLAAALWYGLGKLGDLHAAAREKLGAHDDGRHHAFAGVTLQVEDDGRHVWLDAPGLRRVLGLKETDDVTAARTPGTWRRGGDGRTWLRVDAVIEYIAHMPGRNEPRAQKLRRYLERDVLYPAQERRRRG
jgi:hypothetical protein